MYDVNNSDLKDTDLASLIDILYKIDFPYICMV